MTPGVLAVPEKILLRTAYVSRGEAHGYGGHTVTIPESEAHKITIVLMDGQCQIYLRLV